MRMFPSMHFPHIVRFRIKNQSGSRALSWAMLVCHRMKSKPVPNGSWMHGSAYRKLLLKKKTGTEILHPFFLCYARTIGFLASTAAAAIVAATAVAATAAAEQNNQQNDNPAASTISIKTHNTQSPSCQIYLKQTVFCLFHTTLYATAEIV